MATAPILTSGDCHTFPESDTVSGETLTVLSGQALADTEVTDAFRLSPEHLGRWITSEPPPRDYLIDGLLEAGQPGIWQGRGGLGKSLILLSMSMHLALGRDWGPFTIPRPRGVVLCFLEDCAAELHRRFRAQYDALHLTPAEADRLQRNLRVVPLAGVAGATFGAGGALEAGINATAAEMDSDPLGLAVIDPIGLALELPEGMSFNEARAATLALRALGRIVKATGATVLAVNHLTKLAMREGQEDHAAAGQGSQQFVNHSRVVVALQPVKASEVTEGEGGECRKLVRMSLAKVNAPAPAEVKLGSWVLEILPTGEIAWTELAGRTPGQKAATVLEAIQARAAELGRGLSREEIHAASRLSKHDTDEGRALLEEAEALARLTRQPVQVDGKAVRRDLFEPAADAQERVERLLEREAAGPEDKDGGL